MGTINHLIKKISLFLIRLYQLIISPLTGSNCRFYPSCSAYAYQAINLHGPVRGMILMLKRLFKCHPFHPGGYDAVPEKNNKIGPNNTKSNAHKIDFPD